MKKPFLLLAIVLLFCGCSGNRLKIRVTNPLSFDRSAEMVEIPIADITSKIKDFTPAELIVVDNKGKELQSQLIYNGQPEPVSLIFQAKVAAGIVERPE